jgi:hypothetical protein
MEEDIIILETAIKYSKKQFEELGEYTYLDKDKMQSIENLIKRNTELKEDAKRQLLLEMPDGIYLKSHILDRHDLSWQRDLNDFISKSKIKEKIEEIKKYGYCVTEDYYLCGEDEYTQFQEEFTKEEQEENIIAVLEELLKE